MASFGSLPSTAATSPVSSDLSSEDFKISGSHSHDLTLRGPGQTTYIMPAHLQCDTHSRNILKDREPNFFAMDHSYAKPCYFNPSASKTMPTRTLMFDYPDRRCHSPDEVDEVLDVETTAPPAAPSYDSLKSRVTMGECERFVESTLLIGGEDDSGRQNDEDDWEERVSRTNWTFPQIRLFTRATRILHLDRLARLTHEGAFNEPIMRRIAVDKSAKRLRQVLGSVNWESFILFIAPNLVQWLHTVFMSHLSAPYLANYLEILQVLKSKVPSLVDVMMAVPPSSKSTSSSGSGSSLNDSLAQILKKPWDPTSVSYMPKPKKLPGSAMVVIAPFGPFPSAFNQMRRMRFWSSQFAALGKMIPVTMHSTSGGRNQRIGECLEHMMTATRNKVSELRTSFPSRPIVLIGWSVAAVVACHVALTERVAAIVCLGFPSCGIGGTRGEVDDPLLDLKTPTLFVVGQMSTLCNFDDLEDMRENMKTETSLLVVGGADDLLRVCHKKKRMESVTQSMVDRYIMEEVNKFLSNILFGFVSETTCGTARGMPSTSFGTYESSTSAAMDVQKRRKRKSTGTVDDDLPDLEMIRNQLKSATERRKEAQQSNVPLNPDICGIQLSPLLASLNSPPLDASAMDVDLKLLRRRNYTSLRVVPAPKKTKFNTNVMPVESSSSTSESSSNSLPGETGCGSSAIPRSDEQQETAEDFASLPINTKQQSSPPSSSGGITVSIGALSSLAQLRASPVTTSLVNRSSPSKTSSPPKLSTATATDVNPIPTIAVMPSTQRSPTAFARSLPITIKGPSLRSAFSVARTTSIPSLTTYSLSSKKNSPATSTSTTPSSSASTSTSLLLTNKVGAFETIRQAGRLIVCKSSEVTNREKFLDQVQAIQKMQFHDFPLTTASLTRTPGSPIITQAKILTSRGFDLKKLQTLSTSIASHLRAGGSSSAAATTTTGATATPMPSLLIATGGGMGKPIFVSGSAANLAKMCQRVGAETTTLGSSSSSSDSVASATAKSVLEQARRVNPHFTVSSVKLHIPERKSASSKGGPAPKVSLIMLSSNKGSKVPQVEKPKVETSEQQTLDANEGAALLLDLARSAPAAANWQQQQQQEAQLQQQQLQDQQYQLQEEQLQQQEHLVEQNIQEQQLQEQQLQEQQLQEQQLQEQQLQEQQLQEQQLMEQQLQEQQLQEQQLQEQQLQAQQLQEQQLQEQQLQEQQLQEQQLQEQQLQEQQLQEQQLLEQQLLEQQLLVQQLKEQQSQEQQQLQEQHLLAQQLQEQQLQQQQQEPEASGLMDSSDVESIMVVDPQNLQAAEQLSRTIDDSTESMVTTDSDCVIIDEVPRKPAPTAQKQTVDEVQLTVVGGVMLDDDATETSKPGSSGVTEKANAENAVAKVTEDAQPLPPTPSTSTSSSSSKGSSSRSKPPPFPTIAATRTRRIRVPKYMYYEV